MRIWHHTNGSDKGNWRGWLHLVNKEEHDLFATSLEISWKKSYRTLGFKLHIGGKGSDTPIDWMVGLWWITFYGSFSADWLRSFAEWIGHGHKRSLMLRISSGSIWWALWYDDDGGYDRTGHDTMRCKHKRPWFWPFGKKDAYRSWACLREGNQELNPLTATWGPRYFSYVTVEEDILLIEINDFPGDEYMIEFKLQEEWRERRRGPKWARRRRFEGHTAEWSAPGAGISVQNHSWKGNGILGSGVKVKSRDTWRMDADIALTEFIRKERERNGYHPPVGRITDYEITDEGLSVTGEIWDVDTKKAIQGNSLKHMSVGFDQTDRGIAMAMASMMEDGTIDMKTSYLEFSADDAMADEIAFKGTIPDLKPKDDLIEIEPQTFMTREAMKQLADQLPEKFIVLGDDVRIESLSLDHEPNVFGGGIHLVGEDLDGVAAFDYPDDLSRVAEWEKANPPKTDDHDAINKLAGLTKPTDEDVQKTVSDWDEIKPYPPCTYEKVWTDEVGEIDVCTFHGQNSKHSAEEGPNRPCLQIDPWEEKDVPH